MVDEV